VISVNYWGKRRFFQYSELFLRRILSLFLRKLLKSLNPKRNRLLAFIPNTKIPKTAGLYSKFSSGHPSNWNFYWLILSLERQQQEISKPELLEVSGSGPAALKTLD
jgi:hypothetical protein